MHPDPQLEDRLAAMEARLARIEEGPPRDRDRDLDTINPAAMYTIAEAARRLRIGKSTAYALAREGKLRPRAVGPGGKAYRILGADLIAFLRADADADADAGPRRRWAQ